MFGASGAIGRALVAQLDADSRFARVLGYSRSSNPPLELTDESSIAAVVSEIARQGSELRLAIDATGALHDEGCVAEKTWDQIDPRSMAQGYAVNAIGPALVMKHVLPLLPRAGKSVFATLSARVGSIDDNRLGGWYGYRASKAALNQIVRTASIELSRKRPQAVCVALHPGTVDSPLSAPFAKAGLAVQAPEAAAARLLGVIESLRAEHSGGFFDQHGAPIPW